MEYRWRSARSEFAGVRQIDLKRVDIVKDTMDEVAAWKETADYKKKVLSKAWVMTDEERKDEDARLREEVQMQRTMSLRAQVQGQKHARRRQDYVTKNKQLERQREKKRAAAEAELNAGALI